MHNLTNQTSLVQLVESLVQGLVSRKSFLFHHLNFLLLQVSEFGRHFSILHGFVYQSKQNLITGQKKIYREKIQQEFK